MDLEGNILRKFSSKKELVTYFKYLLGLEYDSYWEELFEEQEREIVLNDDAELRLADAFVEAWRDGAVGIQQICTTIADAAKENQEYLDLRYTNYED